MDTLSVIVLTAVINAFVTASIGGIILYRIQKKIDNSYFEHQTKFVGTHAKRVETLQTLYKKLVIYYESFDYMVRQASYVYASMPEKINITADDYEKFSLQVADFRKYLFENRLFLSDEMAHEILTISGWVRGLHEDTFEILPFNDTFDAHIGIKITLQSYYEYQDVENAPEDWESLDYADILGLMNTTMYNLLGRVEKLYKSVADNP